MFFHIFAIFLPYLELFRNDKSYARLRFFRQDSSEARLTEPPSEDTTQSDSLPKEKKHINEKKWEEMRRHGDSEKNDCSQCLLFITDSLLWFIHVESSVEFLKGTMLYSCAIFFDSFSAMCFMAFFWHSLLPSHRNASHRFSLVRMMLIPRTSDNARTAVKFKTLQDVEQSCFPKEMICAHHLFRLLSYEFNIEGCDMMYDCWVRCAYQGSGFIHCV